MTILGHRFGICALTVTLLCAGALHAQTPLSAEAEKKAIEAAAADPTLDAAAQAVGRALFLRCLCTSSDFAYEANGRLAPGVKTRPADWTLSAVDLTKVVRKGPETVEFEGFRVAIRWNDDNHEFNRHQIKTEPVKLSIAGAGDAAAMQRALDEIFSVGIDHKLQTSMPAYWQHYFNPAMKWPDDLGQIVPVGAKANGVEVQAPALVKKSSAGFTTEAQQDKVQGPVTLLIVIDANGTTKHIQIAQPLGYGLDAMAVESAEKTAFAPPMIAGKPGAVAMYVKESFTLVPLPGS